MQVPGDRKRCWDVCRKTIGCVHVKLSTEMESEEEVEETNGGSRTNLISWEVKSEQKD